MKTEGFSLINGGILMADSTPPEITAGTTGRESAADYTLPGEIVRGLEKKILSDITGVSPEKIIFLNQVHGDKIHVVETVPLMDSFAAAEADALVTLIPGLCLVIRSADCVPVLLYDIKKGAAAAVHSGWRGCRLGIAGKTVEAMKNLAGSDPADIEALIMPSIGPGSYQVGPEFPELFPGRTTIRDGSVYLDLWSSVRESLREAGLHESKIRSAEICTLQHNSIFFSHRGGDPGRNLNFIAMTGR